MSKTYYDILEISPRAGVSIIKAAYKVLMEKYHPDKNPKNTTIAKQLGEAYNTLIDPKLRKKYDNSNNVSTIGSYKVLELIAEGGFGKTYKGEHVDLGALVCIKHASNISPQDEEILMGEARAIWDLRHYAIPAIRDILKLDDGSLALVMSYIPGPTIEQIIEKNKSLDCEHVCWITERILNALMYLHYHGVVHGDVKPQNIIVQPDSHQVALVDYGLSIIKPTKESSAKGYTPFFAPPEQIGGLTLLPESDFYSLGMTMIYMLGGDIERKHVPADAPTPLCEFIKKLIVRDILGRPRWEGENLIETLQNIRKKCFKRDCSLGMKIPDF